MLRRPRRLWSRLVLLGSIIGPGIITANIDNDAGGIATYSIAGAHFGYALLWTMVPATVVLIVVQEMASRMGVVTGKGLAAMIRERFGVLVTFWLMVALLLTDLGNTTAEFAGWAASMELFGVSKYISVPLGALFIWLLVVKGTYRAFERIFLGICLVYLTYIVAAVMAKPDWVDVVKHTLRPTLRFDAAYLSMTIGLVGTTIAPWMQFYLQSAIVEKGVRPDQYWGARVDVIVGSFMTDIVALFIMVACGATLFHAGIRVDSAEQAAQALTPLAGRYASLLFAAGLANASLFSACILPLATAFYICEAMGWEAGVDKTLREAPQFMGLYTGFIVVGAMIVMIPRVPLIPIMWITQVINGIMLPFVLLLMLKLVNDETLMKGWTNSRFQNSVAWATTWVMIALTVGLLVSAVV
ncbi:MAG: divalent metal cation transporter [Chloroflexi bacterium]|nr:MAG: divalent metal cation transporter [Chloroflexota bacterium]